MRARSEGYREFNQFVSGQPMEERKVLNGAKSHVTSGRVLKWGLIKKDVSVAGQCSG